MDFLLCNVNLSCHLDTLKDYLTGPKYSSEVAEVCQYYEEQKYELPEYCLIKPKPPKRRNEF